MNQIRCLSYNEKPDFDSFLLHTLLGKSTNSKPLVKNLVTVSTRKVRNKLENHQKGLIADRGGQGLIFPEFELFTVRELQYI